MSLEGRKSHVQITMEGKRYNSSWEALFKIMKTLGLER